MGVAAGEYRRWPPKRRCPGGFDAVRCRVGRPAFQPTVAAVPPAARSCPCRDPVRRPVVRRPHPPSSTPLYAGVLSPVLPARRQHSPRPVPQERRIRSSPPIAVAQICAIWAWNTTLPPRVAQPSRTPVTCRAEIDFGPEVAYLVDEDQVRQGFHAGAEAETIRRLSRDGRLRVLPQAPAAHNSAPCTLPRRGPASRRHAGRVVRCATGGHPGCCSAIRRTLLTTSNRPAYGPTPPLEYPSWLAVVRRRVVASQGACSRQGDRTVTPARGTLSIWKDTVAVGHPCRTRPRIAISRLRRPTATPPSARCRPLAPYARPVQDFSPRPEQPLPACTPGPRARRPVGSRCLSAEG